MGTIIYMIIVGRAKQVEVSGMQMRDEVHPRLYDDFLVDETLLNLRSR